MKSMLLIVLTLIVVPAWAADAPSAPPSQEPSTQTKQAVPKHKAKHKAKLKAKEAAPTAAIQKTIPPKPCNAGCANMNCPPPSGPMECCNTTTHQAC